MSQFETLATDGALLPARNRHGSIHPTCRIDGRGSPQAVGRDRLEENIQFDRESEALFRAPSSSIDDGCDLSLAARHTGNNGFWGVDTVACMASLEPRSGRGKERRMSSSNLVQQADAVFEKLHKGTGRVGGGSLWRQLGHVSGFILVRPPRAHFALDAVERSGVVHARMRIGVLKSITAIRTGNLRRATGFPFTSEDADGCLEAGGAIAKLIERLNPILRHYSGDLRIDGDQGVMLTFEWPIDPDPTEEQWERIGAVVVTVTTKCYEWLERVRYDPSTVRKCVDDAQSIEAEIRMFSPAPEGYSPA